MNISAAFIQRPIATVLLMAGLLLGGLVTYRLLPVAALPSVNFPTIQVTAQLPGADPQTMAILGRNTARATVLADSRRHTADIGKRARIHPADRPV